MLACSRIWIGSRCFHAFQSAWLSRGIFRLRTLARAMRLSPSKSGRWAEVFREPLLAMAACSGSVAPGNPEVNSHELVEALTPAGEGQVVADAQRRIGAEP